MVGSVIFKALAISAQVFLSVESYDTINIATPAIVWGYFPWIIYS